MTNLAVTIRQATPGDLEAVVRLYADDAIGGSTDAWTSESFEVYRAALDRLAAWPGHSLHVAEYEGRVVGTFILSLLPGLTNHGAMIAQLRSVQVAAAERSRGIGRLMVAAAEQLALEAGAGVLELTSNLRRIDAHRFYEREGYARSHAGFKKRLLA